LDAEKVYVELCVLLVIGAIALRVKWQARQPPPRKHIPKRRRQTATEYDQNRRG
jgi:hypothetical protein